MRFQIYQDGKPVTDFDLAGAYVFGPDRTPLRASNNLSFSDGFLQCESNSFESAGLTVMWPIKGFGKVLLPTTRLRERSEPYLLNLEMARARLMQITIKREDWAYFDSGNSIGKLLDETQQLFIEALRNISDLGKCAKLSDECLEKAMIFSEKFAQKYAESFISLRYKNRSFGRHTLGCRMQEEVIKNAACSKKFFETFGFVDVPLNWAKIEKIKGELDFTEVDHYFEALAGKKVFVMAGPLLCFKESSLPEWLKDECPDFGKIQEYAYNFVSNVVKRYSKKVNFWRIVSGLNAFNYFKFNFEQSLEMSRTSAIASRSVDSKSKKLIEIVQPWGEYYAYDQQTIPPLVYVDMILQSGINFDGIGVQLHFGADESGMLIRDMMQVSARLDCFAAVPKPLFVTSVCVPNSSDSAGVWHGQWSEEIQSAWLESFYKIALGKPFINNITYAGLVDSAEMPMPEAGLLDKDCQPLKAYKTMLKLQKFLLKK